MDFLQKPSNCDKIIKNGTISYKYRKNSHGNW